MKPRDAFSLIVRCLGLLLSLNGAFHAYKMVLRLTTAWYFDFGPFWLIGVPSLVVGVWFLRGAPRLISFCYGSGEQDEG